jgi:hypothetical protein
MLREGVQANDEVLLVPSGAWVAERGPLRPGLEALAAHLRDAGAGVKIAKALCVCCPDCPSASLEHELTRPSFARVRKYPSRADSGRAFTAGLKRVLAKDVRAVDAAAMSDIVLDEQAAREYTNARSVAGGKASSLKQGSAWLEANGYTEQDFTDDDARAAWGRSSGQIGGKATIASHGLQMGNGGKATILSHGDQLGNGGRESTTDSLLEFSPILS